MNKIIVGFSRPKAWFSPFSWLIRLVTWSPYSHVYIKFYSATYDRWLIYQASGTKVNFIGQTLFDAEEVLCGEFSISVCEKTIQKTVQFAIDKCGSPYGALQIVGFGWVLFMNLFGKKVKNPFYSTSSYFCSEIANDMLEEIKSVNDTMDPAVASPRDVYNFLIAKGYQLVSGG
jgi:hypothetical protein